MDEVYLRELEKRYKNTVVAIHNQVGEERVVYVKEIMYDTPPRLRVYLPPVAGREPQSTFFTLTEWTILPPPSRRVFDANGTTYSYSKVPARQWRRGICADNSSVSPLLTISTSRFKGVTRLIGWDNKVLNGQKLEVLQHLFNPKYLSSISNGLEHLQKNPDSLSVSLSAENWLSYSPTGEGFTLWRRENPIADVSGRQLKLHHSLYHQEVTDFLQRTGGNYAIC